VYCEDKSGRATLIVIGALRTFISTLSGLLCSVSGFPQVY